MAGPRYNAEGQLLGEKGNEPGGAPGAYVDPNTSLINRGLGGAGAQAIIAAQPPKPMPGEGPAAYAARLRAWKAEQADKAAATQPRKVSMIDPMFGLPVQEAAPMGGLTLGDILGLG